MTTIRCKTCGNPRALNKINEERLLRKNNNSIELVKENYVCRVCKRKAKEQK